ncbi:choice-of-anchor L domain-containing protein [Gemmobacter denitrificans]|uniref:Choice-of-anchor L domain-containing protein n=1 Tax=Gemmobacter denitrificans TaxID=3123040 RepID=A0ABU8BXE7_9RHOB
MATASELAINTQADALQMANEMFGSGISVVNATYIGAQGASGIYSGAQTTMPGVAPSDSGVILSTGNVTDITQSLGDANISAGTSTIHGTAGDAGLSQMAGAETFDAAVLTADFIPTGNMMTMQVVFSSEEYLEYVGSGFNDAVGIWVNGVRAELMVGNGDITIDNINNVSNSNLYVDNPASAQQFNTEMDGFTITLTLKAPVNPGVVNTIKIGIADSGDATYDSNLFIAGDSVQVALVAQDDMIELGKKGSVTVDVLDNDVSTLGSALTITHINGQPVVAGSTITLPTGEEITLNADGTLTFESDSAPKENLLTYTVEDEYGNTDVGYITVETLVPCFVAGTPIRTALGDLPVEQIRPGMQVLTQDHGLQTVRWSGQRRVPAQGRLAPVRIAAHTFGDHGTISVSAQHRILVAGARAELLFGQAEVLVPAHALCDGRKIRRRPDGGMVTYVHLLFDRHEIIFAAGLPTESFHPGATVLSKMEAESRREILMLFPELADLGAPPMARPALTAREGVLLRPS